MKPEGNAKPGGFASDQLARLREAKMKFNVIKTSAQLTS